MIKKELQILLDEIYSSHPEMKKKEKEIIKIINDINLLKPNIQINETNKEKIKQQILTKLFFHNKSKTKRFSILNRFAYSLAGMAFATIILLPILNTQHQKAKQIEAPNWELSQKNIMIEKSFGMQNSLNYQDDSQNIKSRRISLDQTESIVSESIWYWSYETKTATIEPILIDTDEYIPTKYFYQFNWSLPKTKETMNVYTFSQTNDIFQKLEQNLNIKNIDLSSFKNLEINNISLNEKWENWYNIYIDKNWNININKNINIYNRWDTNTNKQIDQDLAKKSTQKFIAKFDIDISQYWEPIVENGDSLFARYEDDELNKSMLYPSQEIIVNYPYYIDNYPVYEQYWDKLYWTKFNLNNDYEILSVYDLKYNKLTKKEYELEKDINKILNQIKNNNEIFNADQVNTVEIELINPEISYVRYSQYLKNETIESLIPAIIFWQQYKSKDIENHTNNYYNINNKIVVPLIKNFKQQFESEELIPIIYQ